MGSEHQHYLAAAKRAADAAEHFETGAEIDSEKALAAIYLHRGVWYVAGISGLDQPRPETETSK